MNLRFAKLGLWLAGIYLVLLAIAYVTPEEWAYPFGVLIRMMPGTILWPWVLVLEKAEAEATFLVFTLYVLFGPVWFWFIGRLISTVATYFFPLNEKPNHVPEPMPLKRHGTS